MQSFRRSESLDTYEEDRRPRRRRMMDMPLNIVKTSSSTLKVSERIAPAPLGSGISFRRLPDPELKHLIQACQFYERKCAGGRDRNIRRHDKQQQNKTNNILTTRNIMTYK